MAEKKFIEEIEKAKEGKVGRPSVGPVYRNVLVKEGSRPLAQGLESCWDIFRESVKKYANHQMLGEREIVNGKAGKCVWLTYREVHDLVLQVGVSFHSCIDQACNAHGLYCMPLYDTLGAGAVKYIICHAELSLVFVEENKISELL